MPQNCVLLSGNLAQSSLHYVTAQVIAAEIRECFSGCGMKYHGLFWYPETWK